jgi:hypothetical protein
MLCFVFLGFDFVLFLGTGAAGGVGDETGRASTFDAPMPRGKTLSPSARGRNIVARSSRSRFCVLHNSDKRDTSRFGRAPFLQCASHFYKIALRNTMMTKKHRKIASLQTVVPLRSCTTRRLSEEVQTQGCFQNALIQEG